MKARREQVDEKLLVIKLFAINYARDLIRERNIYRTIDRAYQVSV